MGAWRTLRNAGDEWPFDVAKRVGHSHLLAILQPEYRRDMPPDALQSIQGHFHDLIREQVGSLAEDEGQRLPQLEPLLEVEKPRMWFWVPEFAGCFGYGLVRTGSSARLVAVSSGRGTPRRRHLISPAGVEVLDGEDE